MRYACRIVCTAILLLICGTDWIRASVVVTPSVAHLNPGQTLQFNATGSSIGVYIWSLSGPGCLGITCGMITSEGFYSAPANTPSPGIITVTALSLSDLTQQGTATVTMGSQGAVGISVSPSEVSVGVGAQQLFKAAVTGTTNTGVTWSVSGYSCAGTACGTITTAGLYTAPSVLPNPAIVFVTAKSVADSTKSSTATVNLKNIIKVSVSPAAAQVKLGATQQFTAQVTGTTITGVKWTVSGGGCSGAACGTISSSGLYTAPATVPNPASVTITATSTADSSTSASAVVTLVIPIGISISPTAVSLIAGEQLQFHDSVFGTSNTAVRWSTSGASCSGTACGTISSTGLYTAPASIAAQMSIIVTVTSQASQAVSASASVTILRSTNSKLNGHYAFLLTGFDAHGAYQQAGSINADGNGKILSGKEDVTTTAIAASELSITGSYQISSDNRGVVTLLGPLGTQTLRLALNSAGTSGKLISFDKSGIQASGVIYQQDPRAFDPSALTGGYVLSFTGANVFGDRVAALGLVFPDGSGFISGSSLDVNEGGVVPPTFATFSGIYDVDATGRGTMTLSVPGFDGGLFHFALYIVSPKQLIVSSTDPLNDMTPLMSGTGVLQSGTPFTAASFSGPTVFQLTGTTGAGGDDTIGRMLFKGGNSLSINYDRNAAGAITTGGVMSGAYDMQLNGRGTLNLSDAGNGSAHIWLIYATAPDAGFLMDISSGAAGMGEIKPQLTIPFSNATLIGTYVLGSGEPIATGASLYSGTLEFDGGNSKLGTGAVAGTEDTSRGTILTPSQVVTGAYSVSIVSNNGRGSIVLTSPQASNIAIWAAGPSLAYGLQVDAGATRPVVLHIEQ